MHMPLTPEANLPPVSFRERLSCCSIGVLDKLLSLDVVHAVDTGDTVTDGQDTSSLGEAVLLLDTADPLLQDGGNLGGGGLRFGGVGSGSVDERGSAGLWRRKGISTASR